jgi:hypothetical protein
MYASTLVSVDSCARDAEVNNSKSAGTSKTRFILFVSFPFG